MVDWPRRDDNKKHWVIVIPFKRFYSVKEAARILGGGHSGVYHKIKRGTLHGVQVDGIAMVRHASLVDYIRRRKKAEKPPGPGSKIVPIVPTPPKSTHDSSKRMPKPTPELLTLVETEFSFL